MVISNKRSWSWPTGARWAGSVVSNARWLSLLGRLYWSVLLQLEPPQTWWTLDSLWWRHVCCVLVRLLTTERLRCCCLFWKETPGNEEEIPFPDSQAWWERRHFLRRRWLGANHRPESEGEEMWLITFLFKWILLLFLFDSKCSGCSFIHIRVHLHLYGSRSFYKVCAWWKICLQIWNTTELIDDNWKL